MTNQVSELLITEYTKRANKNGHYSLRAFARDIELAPSHLSTLLKGKSGLSKENASRIAKELGWSKKKSEIFVETAESEFSRSSILRKVAQKRVEKIISREETKENLKPDEFQFISQWYHLAILELFEVHHFKMNNNYIANKLGISEEEAKEAITRLVRLKLIVLKEGKLQPNTEATFVGDGVCSSAIRSFHSQIIKKANEAVTQQDRTERILRSSILAIKKDKLAEALIMLQEFHDRFGIQLNDYNANEANIKDEVYCLSSQFFRLTTPSEVNR